MNRITTQRAIRAAFWREWWSRPRPKRLRSGDWPTDVRVSFVAFVDYLYRDGSISEALADRVTL